QLTYATTTHRVALARRGVRRHGRRVSRPAGGSARVDLDGLTDDVEDAAQLVVVLVLHAQPGVGHVAGGDRLGRRAVGRQVDVDQVLAERVADRLEALVAGDVAGGVAPRRGGLGAAGAHRERPLAIEVHVVADVVEVPRAHARWPTPDLA